MSALTVPLKGRYLVLEDSVLVAQTLMLSSKGSRRSSGGRGRGDTTSENSAGISTRVSISFDSSDDENDFIFRKFD